MPIQDLLAQVAAEHEALQSKYDAALIEVDFLRSQLAHFLGPGSTIKSCGLDTLAIPSRHVFLPEAIHGAAPDGTAPAPMNRSQLVLYEELEANRIDSCRLDTLAVPSRHQFLPEAIHGAPEGGGPGLRKSQSVLIDDAEKGGTTSVAKQDQDDIDDWAVAASPTDRYLATHKLARFVHHPIVEIFFFAVVLSNVVFICYDTNRRASDLPQEPWATTLAKVYLGFYVFEFAVRVLAFHWHVFDDKWVRLDVGVIVIDLVVVFLEAVAGKGVFGDLNISVLRLLRVFRIVRLLKVLRFIIEIQLLIHGLFGAVKAVLFATVMLEVVLLLFALLYVEIIDPLIEDMVASGEMSKCSGCLDAYSSLWNAHMTIFQQQVAGDSWGTLHVDIARAHPPAAILFVSSLMTIQFAMLNLILTVIVDAAGRARAEDEQLELEEKRKTFAKQRQRLMELCASLDENGNGELTLDELLEGYHNNQAFADTMASLDVGADDMQTLFMIMDEDRSGTVSQKEFVNNIYKMKEQDTRTLLMFIKAHTVDIRLKINQDIKDDMKIMKDYMENVRNTIPSEQGVHKVVAEVFAENKSQDMNALSAPDFSELEKKVQRVSEVQELTLHAIQQQTQVFVQLQGTASSMGCSGVTKGYADHLISVPQPRPAKPQNWH